VRGGAGPGPAGPLPPMQCTHVPGPGGGQGASRGDESPAGSGDAQVGGPGDGTHPSTRRRWPCPLRKSTCTCSLSSRPTVWTPARTSRAQTTPRTAGRSPCCCNCWAPSCKRPKICRRGARAAAQRTQRCTVQPHAAGASQKRESGLCHAPIAQLTGGCAQGGRPVGGPVSVTALTVQVGRTVGTCSCGRHPCRSRCPGGSPFGRAPVGKLSVQNQE
jgi:hypothetical protein